MLTMWQKLKKEREASTHPDIDLVDFVSRGKLVVLRTSPETFELMTKKEKLDTIDYMEKSLKALKEMIQKE